MYKEKLCFEVWIVYTNGVTCLPAYQQYAGRHVTPFVYTSLKQQYAGRHVTPFVYTSLKQQYAGRHVTPFVYTSLWFYLILPPIFKC
jgi:hypothetical protein